MPERENSESRSQVAVERLLFLLPTHSSRLQLYDYDMDVNSCINTSIAFPASSSRDSSSTSKLYSRASPHPARPTGRSSRH